MDGRGYRSPNATRYLRRAGEIYAEHSSEIAELITAEMGSPITFSRNAQGPIAQHVLAYFTALGDRFEVEQHRTELSAPVSVIHDPSGVVAAIAPWNYPQALMLMKIAPALVAGCTVVAKPSPETALDGLLLAQIFDEAGLPPGVLNVVPADREAGEHLISHPGVDRVAFTGSTEAGRRVAEICGRDLRRCTLELGGKSAALVLDDADIALTVEGLRDVAFRNSGQTCTNQTRILVPHSRHRRVHRRLLRHGVVDGGRRSDRSSHRDRPTRVAASAASALRAMSPSGRRRAPSWFWAVGGRPASTPAGMWSRPCSPGPTTACASLGEEIFGPVVCLIPYTDDEEDWPSPTTPTTAWPASVWGTDVDRATALAQAACGPA